MVGPVPNPYSQPGESRGIRRRSNEAADRDDAWHGFLIALALSNQADAYWRGGVWIEPAPPPYYYAPPPVVVAPPPTYYAPPPPVVYQPPPPAAMVPPRTGTAYGTMCFAGVYRWQ